MTAREIAKDFVSTMNPSGWDGSGNRPDSTPLNEVLTYHLDEYPEINLDLHYEYDDLEDQYYHVCEAYDKESNDRMCGVWSNTINDVDDVIGTIQYLFDNLGVLAAC